MTTEIKTNLESFFLEHSTPKKNYPITKDPDIAIALSPTAKQKEAIYRFKGPDGTRYYGSAAIVNGRMQRHLSDFRHPEKDRGQKALAKAVQLSDTSDFDFGVVCTIKDLPKELSHLSLAELETHYIDYKKSLGTRLFNKRRGGGGGSAKERTHTKREVKKAAQKVSTLYTSPVKSYKVDPESLRVDLTPEAKKAKDNIYIIKCTKSGKRYIGKTEREVKKRLAEHSSYARHPENETGKKPLYRDMRKRPEDFEIKLINPESFEEDDLDLVEKALIRYFKDQEVPLYNSNGGGGGGHKRVARVARKLFT